MVCCDGTWKRADDVDVSNIEKIARAVAPVDGTESRRSSITGPAGTGGSKTERLVGGAFGDRAGFGHRRRLPVPGAELREGVTRSTSLGSAAVPGTARSLVGMIANDRTAQTKGVASGKLPKALKLYRERRGASPDSIRGSRETQGQGERGVCTVLSRTGAHRVLGVFDTVGRWDNRDRRDAGTASTTYD